MFKKLLQKFISWRIRRTHYLYLDGRMSLYEHETIINRMKLLKAKWIKDECHHLCLFCEFKSDCFNKQ